MEGTEVDQHVGGQEKVRDERGNQVEFSNQYKAKERKKNILKIKLYLTQFSRQKCLFVYNKVKLNERNTLCNQLTLRQ